jgi:hypothetical protein
MEETTVSFAATRGRVNAQGGEYGNALQVASYGGLRIRRQQQLDSRINMIRTYLG